MALVVTDVHPLSQQCDGAPSLASARDLLFMAWKGIGNDIINISVSNDGGLSFRRKFESTIEFTIVAPCITSLDDTLYIAWTGTDQPRSLNVAAVVLGTDGIERTVSGFDEKTTLSEFSDAAPALAAYNGLLYLARKGYGNNNITILSSSDVFQHHNPPQSTPVEGNLADHPLSMASYNGNLYIAWKGTTPTPYLQIAIVEPSLTAFDDQNPVNVDNSP